MSKKVIWFVVLSSLIIGGFGGWVFNRYIMPKIASISFLAKYDLAPPAGSPLVINRKEEIHVNEGSDSIAAIQQVKPWLVSIVTGSDPLHAQVQGAGIILTSDGIIAIPRTLISSKTQTFQIGFNDGSVAPAKLLAEDPASDLVLIKADANNLPTANLGYSRDLQLGQRMVILFPTVNEYHATNVISFLSSDSRTFTDKIYSADKFTATFKIDDQTNVPEGSMVVSLDGSAQGIYVQSNVVTADVIRDFLNRYFKDRAAVIPRAYLGFSYQPISKTLASLYSLSAGDLVRKVDLKSPAATAGLKEGDVITSINGQAINLDNTLEDFIRSNTANFSAKISVNRAGKNTELNITAIARTISQ